MDHTSRLHLAELERAEDLAYAGNKDEALAICFKLRLQASLAVYLRACVNLLMACLIKEPNREKFARECIDLLDILVQNHEHEEDIESKLEHVEEMNKVAELVIERCRKRRQQKMDVDAKTPETPTADIGKRLSDMDIDKPVEKIFQSKNWGNMDALTANPPRIEGFLRDPYFHRPLGASRATPIARPTQPLGEAMSTSHLAALDIHRRTPSPLSSSQPSSPPQPFTSSQRDSESSPTFVRGTEEKD